MRALRFTTGIFFMIAFGLCSCNYSSVSAEPNKLALIIAVANYPQEGGWTTISSDKDIELIKNTLLKQGFKESNIKIIVDQQAKKEGIVQEIKDLINRANPGDIVVIHYSGHGQQIMDNTNKDEIDGYDESIVPYDAQLKFKKGVYEGESHLRDDELGNLFYQLREKIGGNGDLLVVLDACHSGTGTRGFGKSRGTSTKFESEDYTPTEGTGDEKGFDEGANSSRGAASSKDVAPMVLFSGASQQELNYEYTDDEGNSYGSLSYAISKVLANAPKNSTYRGVFDMIKLEMSVIAPKQSPQIEGDVDKGIFGGKAVDQQNYYLVNDWIDDKTLTLKAGTLMGLNDNSIVELYPMNTADPSKAKPLAKGKIANASILECDVILEQGLSKDIAQKSWVFVKEQNFGSMSAKVKVNISDEKLKTAVLNGLSKVKTAQVVEQNPNVIIELDKTKNKIQLFTSNDQVLYSEDYTAANIDQYTNKLVEGVKSFAQVNLLRNLNMADENLKVTFEIIPITVKRVGSRFVEDQKLDINSRLVNGNLEFKDGDCFKIKVKNDGYTPAYYQILDIQADNNVGLLIPSGNKTASEYLIYPNEEVELQDIFAFGEPYGKEMFKLISTEKPINLAGIITTRGTGTRGGEMSLFEQLVMDSYSQTRAATISIPPAAAHIESKIIIVKK